MLSTIIFVIFTVQSNRILAEKKIKINDSLLSGTHDAVVA